MLFGVCGFGLAFLVPDIVTLSLFVSYLAIIFAPPIIAGLYSKKISANAVFYSILIPTVFLFMFFSIIGNNIFVILGAVGILILLFYDKIFKKKVTSYLTFTNDKRITNEKG